MYLKLWLLAVVILLGGTFAAKTTTDTYLGSAPSKPFHFPWLVSFHYVRDRRNAREFFGSGSMLTKKWVLTSMDNFIAYSSVDRLPYYMGLKNVFVTLGYPYAEAYKEDNRDLPIWMEVRKVGRLIMYEDPKKTYEITFTKSQIPYQLNAVKRSSFGFSMSIALVELMKYKSNKKDWVELRRSILPIPVYFGQGQSGEVQESLRKEFELLEVEPFGVRCHVGGWRIGDWRLVDYEVVYVPFEHCESIYCSHDNRACLQWPIKGIHVCFKSLTFTDPCWRDQGSALYCEQLSESVIAILTTAPTCGYNGLPGVFTLINHGLELLEYAEEKISWYKAIPKSELLIKFGPRSDENSFPAY